MDKCDRCSSADYVTDTKVAGGYETMLCIKCRNAWAKYSCTSPGVLEVFKTELTGIDTVEKFQCHRIAILNLISEIEEWVKNGV